MKFYPKINILKSILHKNTDIVVKRIKEEFLDRVLMPKIVVSTVPKKNLMIVLPYLGKISLQTRTRSNRVMKY